MKIGEVAKHFGLPTHVLRHWESVGLLSPTRATGDHRRYTQDDLYRVASILRAKQAGLPLQDIRSLLTTTDAAARKSVLRRNHTALQAKLAATQSALTLLEAGLNCTHEDLTTCPHFQSHLKELAAVTPHPLNCRNTHPHSNAAATCSPVPEATGSTLEVEPS